MKISGKKSSILVFVFIIGMQPITNYASYYDSESTLTEKLRNIAASILTYIGDVIEYNIKSKYVRPWIEKKIEKIETFVKPSRQAAKTITFKDYIGVPETAINLVEQLKHPEKYIQMGISIPHGILLTGDPGVGKTYLAQAIAGEVDCPFFEYSATGFLGQYVGESEDKIRRAFQEARNAAQKARKNIAIIFIDEFDAIGKRSSSDESGQAKVQSSMINTFLTEMGGFEKNQIPVIVIAATNFPDNIDPALRRPGRFDYIIHIPYPQKEGRLKLLRLAVQNKPMDPNINFENLADATEGMSPADLKLIFDIAGNIALQHNNIERDYDSFVKAIWQIKEKNSMLKMASREDRKNLINQYCQKLQLPNNITEDLLTQTTDMTITDINEIFERAYKFSQEKPEKTLLDWLWIAIAAKKQQMKIRKNKEAFELCKKIYGLPNAVEPSQKALLTIDADHIFSSFNVSYPNTPEIQFIEENNNQDINAKPSVNILGE